MYNENRYLTKTIPRPLLSRRNTMTLTPRSCKLFHFVVPHDAKAPSRTFGHPALRVELALGEGVSYLQQIQSIVPPENTSMIAASLQHALEGRWYNKDSPLMLIFIPFNGTKVHMRAFRRINHDAGDYWLGHVVGVIGVPTESFNELQEVMAAHITTTIPIPSLC